MALQRLTRAVGDFSRRFFTQDGIHYRRETQELTAAIKRSNLIREAEAAAKYNPMGRSYIGSVPYVVLTDWLKARGYTYDQFARNEGGTRCPPGADPKAHAMLDKGVRSEFLRYFLSRDFAKLHSQHTTTRQETARARKRGHNKLPGTSERGSRLA